MSVRLELLDLQVVALAEHLATAVEQGWGVDSALESAAMELGPPLGPKLAATRQEVRRGVPLAEALERLVDRMGNDGLELLVRTVLVRAAEQAPLGDAMRLVANLIRHGRCGQPSETAS